MIFLLFFTCSSFLVGSAEPYHLIAKVNNNNVPVLQASFTPTLSIVPVWQPLEDGSFVSKLTPVKNDPLAHLQGEIFLSPILKQVLALSKDPLLHNSLTPGQRNDPNPLENDMKEYSSFQGGKFGMSRYT